MEEVKIPISLEDGGFENGAKRILDRMEDTQREVKKTGMSVDDFAKHMQEVYRRFDKLTAAVNENTSAIGKGSIATKQLGRDLDDTTEKGVAGFGRLEKAAIGFFTIQKAKEFIEKVYEVRGEMESLRISFETLAGERIGKQLYEDIKQFATSTPMMMSDLAKGAQTLLGFNIEAEKVMPILRQIGDISMGDAQKFNSLALAFAQMSSTGKLMGQDLLQMINAGFNPLVGISEKTGKSISQLKDEMSQGKVSVEMVEDAFRAATSEGGKFYGMLEKQSKGIKGAVSNLEGAWQDMLNSIGEQQQGLMVEGISLATSLVQNYEKVGQVLMGLVATYGTYKAAVMMVTAAEKAQALARLAHIKHTTLMQLATDILTKKMAILNATMLANPYVAVATAMGAVISAMFLFRSSTDEATESQKRLTQAFSETQAQITTEQKNIDELFDKLRKAEKGTNEYKDVKEKILNQYGSYLRGLNKEISTLKDVEGAYKAVAKAARDAALARGKEAALSDVNNEYTTAYSKYVGKIYDQIKESGGEKNAKLALSIIQKDLEKTGQVAEDTQLTLKKFGVSMSWFGELNKAEQNRITNTQRINDLYGEQTKKTEENTTAVEHLDTAYKNAEKSYRNAEKWRKTIEKNRSDYTAAEYQEAVEKEKAAKEAFEKVGGDVSDKKAKTEAKAAKEEAAAHAKTIEQELKYQDELRAVKLQGEDARRDAEIAAIRNASVRERAEREEQHRRTLRDIKAQEDEIFKAIYEQRKTTYETNNKGQRYENTATGSKGWQGVKGTLTGDEQEYYDARYKLLKASLDKENAEYSRYVQERYDGEIQALRDYMKEYGSLQDQRAAITAEYDQKIADATDTVQKAALQKQKENALKELDFKELQQSINWEVVFNDLDKLSKSALEDLRKKLKDALDMKDITPENAKVLSEKLLEIDNRLSDNMWTSMIPALKERQRLVNEVKNAEEDIARAQQKVAKATIAQGQSQSSLQSLAKTLLGRNLTKEELASESGAELAKKLNLSGDAAQKLAESFDKAKTSATDLSKAHEQLTLTQKQADNVNNLLRSLTGKGANDQNFGSALTSIFKSAAEAGGGGFIGYASLVQSNINSMAEFTDKIGLAGTDFGDAVHGFADGVNGFMSAIQSLASGDIFGAVNGVIDGFAGLGRAIDSIGGGFLFGDDDRYQEALDKWGWVLDSWKDNIAYERELMEKAYGVKAIEASRDAVKAAQDAAKAAREIYNGWAGSGAGLFSHSNGYNVNGDVKWDLLRQYNSAWYNRMNGDVSNLFSLTWQELEKLKNEAPQFWASIHSVAQDYLDQYIEAGKAAEETLTALNEQLTTTTKENVFDDFLTSLYDLADGAEDVTKSIADNWQKMVNRMVINNLIAKDFQDQLEKWYQRLAKLQSDRAEGRIDDTTYGNRLNDLLNEYNKLFGEAEGKVEKFTKLGIIKPIEDATEKTSDFFSGLRDSFKSFFEDTEADAEEWSKNIAQQIAGDLIEQLVMTDEFDAWMEDWKKRYAEVLNVQAPDERSQRMKMLIEELNAMRDKTGEKAKEIRESLGLIAEGEAGEESVFSNLRDTFLDTLTDIEQDAESFRKKLEETMIKDVLEKQVLNVPITINGMTFDNFDAYVTRWNERYTDAVESGNQAAIDALLEELMQAREITLEAAKELRERLKDVAEDTTFSDMSDNFVSTLMDMSKTADDWAQDLGRSIAKRIIEQMVVTTMVQPLLDNLQKAVDKALGMEGATYESAMNDAGVKGALKDITDAFPGLQTLVRGIMESFGVTFDEIKEGFSDLRGSFVSALTDMEGDAETFGRNIGKAMREQMLDAYIDKQYQEQLAAINEEWAEALESGDPERIAAIEQKVAELYATIGNDEAVKSLIDDIRELGKEAEEADTTFSDMADSWTSALMDMDSDAKDWGKQIGRTLAEKIIKEMIVGKQLQPYLDAIQDAFNKAVSEDGATAASIIAAVTPEIDAATAAMERMNPVIKGIMEQLNLLDEKTSVTPFDNLRSSYLSTLMDMSKETKDWTKEISQMIAESFVDSFVLGSAFDEKLEEWKKRYKEITEDGSLSEEQRMKQLKTLSELIAADTEDSKKQVSEILKWLGIREGQDQSVTMNMAEAATYDQFELYLGMATSHLMVAEQTKSVTQQILSTLQSMSGITSPSENYGQQIFMRLGTTNEYLLAVKRATEAIRSEFATKLDIMNSHLSKL